MSYVRVCRITWGINWVLSEPCDSNKPFLSTLAAKDHQTRQLIYSIKIKSPNNSKWYSALTLTLKEKKQNKTKKTYPVHQNTNANMSIFANRPAQGIFIWAPKPVENASDKVSINSKYRINSRVEENGLKLFRLLLKSLTKQI